MTNILSNTIIAGTTSSYDYSNGGIVYTSIGGSNTAGTSIQVSMSIFNIPASATAGMLAYTTTFIINQTGNNKGYIRTIGINNTYQTPEFIGGLPTLSVSTSTVIQTVTAIMNNTTLTKLFTNATVCSGTV